MNSPSELDRKFTSVRGTKTYVRYTQVLILLCSCIYHVTEAITSCQDIDASACKAMALQNPSMCSDPTLSMTICPNFCDNCPLLCYSCDTIGLDYSSCNTITCPGGEKCLVKTTMTDQTSSAGYSLSCGSKEVCSSTTRRYISLTQRRFIVNENTTNMRDATRTTCCNTDLCNIPTLLQTSSNTTTSTTPKPTTTSTTPKPTTTSTTPKPTTTSTTPKPTTTSTTPEPTTTSTTPKPTTTSTTPKPTTTSTTPKPTTTSTTPEPTTTSTTPKPTTTSTTTHKPTTTTTPKPTTTTTHKPTTTSTTPKPTTTTRRTLPTVSTTVSTTPGICKSDVIVMISSSGDTYDHGKIQNLLFKLITSIDIGVNASHVAIGTFNEYSGSTIIGLDRGYDKFSILRSLNQLKEVTTNNTSNLAAVRYLLDNFRKGNRIDVTDDVIIISDGNYVDTIFLAQQGSPTQMIKDLHGNYSDVYVVAYNNADTIQLESIATDAQHYKFHSWNLHFDSILDWLKQGICV